MESREYSAWFDVGDVMSFDPDVRTVVSCRS